MFKEFACITDHQHSVELKRGSEPICVLYQKRFSWEEDLERRRITHLLQFGVMEMSVSSRGASNLFVSRKDSGIRFFTDIRALNSVTETDAYPMEDVQMTLD